MRLYFFYQDKIQFVIVSHDLNSSDMNKFDTWHTANNYSLKVYTKYINICQERIV